VEKPRACRRLWLEIAKFVAFDAEVGGLRFEAVQELFCRLCDEADAAPRRCVARERLVADRLRLSAGETAYDDPV
jgi:hypothetical protein